ncbi:hypothetical protein F4777DRAFT_540777 [Nemania sp. FL0916]|nr:hypothetical protein F4777DRAFT_540777 [Nemania sp. FL0916]
MMRQLLLLLRDLVVAKAFLLLSQHRPFLSATLPPVTLLRQCGTPQRASSCSVRVLRSRNRADATEYGTWLAV